VERVKANPSKLVHSLALNDNINCLVYEASEFSRATSQCSIPVPRGNRHYLTSLPVETKGNRVPAAEDDSSDADHNDSPTVSNIIGFSFYFWMSVL